MTDTPKVTKRITSQSIRENAKRDYSPKWDGAENWDGNKFTAAFRDAMNYYNLNHSSKDLKPKIIDWMGRNSYEKSQIAALKNTRDSRCGLTMGAVAACLIKGMPDIHEGFNKNRSTVAWLDAEIKKIIETGKNDKSLADSADTDKKPVAAVLNIQDRIKEQACDMTEELDTAIDSWITDPVAFDPKAFKISSLLRGKGVKSAHVRHIKSLYQKNHDELLELASGKADEQLREAYSHNSRENVKKLIDFYDAIMQACDQIAAEAKVLKKPRAKKAKPVEELVKKLKFQLSDTKLGITSVPPATIVGAQGLVVYNTKTRKIGYYVAKSSAGFAVKNSSIADFTEKSTQKTFRKPAEQIKEFKEQNTQKRFETWFNKSVKTTETLLNGRFNEDTIILKVFK